MAEWLNAAVLKTVKAKHLRGFESLPLRQKENCVKELLPIFIWVVVIGAAFAFAWYQGYLLKLSNYLQETQDELKKCTWPTVAELKGSTVVVMVSILLLGGFTVFVDFFATLMVRWIMLI